MSDKRCILLLLSSQTFCTTPRNSACRHAATAPAGEISSAWFFSSSPLKVQERQAGWKVEHMLPGAGGRGEDSNKTGCYLCKSTWVAEPAGKTGSIRGSERRAGQTHCSGAEHQPRVRRGGGELVGSLFRLWGFIHCVRRCIREKVVIEMVQSGLHCIQSLILFISTNWAWQDASEISALKPPFLKDMFSAFRFCA